jgi:photosystem II stability/assembly factor-like uncharacterized protein
LHWQQINTLYTSTSLVDIWFTDTLHGFMTGTNSQYNFFATSDGGLSWHASNPTKNILVSLFFLNASQGYATGFTSIIYTMNGGQTWAEKSLGSVGNQSSWPFVQFISPGTGFLATGKGLYKTTDTGTNWSLVNSHPVTTVFFNGASNGYAVYSPDGFTKSTDGGSSWQDVGHLSPTAIINGTIQFNYLQFTDSQHGWFLSAQALLATADGGANWSSIFSAPSPVLEPFLDLQMFNNQSGFACTSHTILKTSDGGKTWQQVYSNAAVNICSLSFTDEHHGWACCANGIVLKFHP